MANDNPPPKVSSDIAGIRAPGNFQAVEATYYGLTDSDSRSVAALLVLLDSMHRPVRAELYLYEEAAGPQREQTVRQAQQILQGRYYSRQPVPLRVLDVQHESHSVDVALPAAPANRAAPYARTGRGGEPGWRRWLLPAVGAILLLLLLGFATRWLFGRDSPDTATDPATATAVVDGDGDPAAGTDQDAAPNSQFASDASLPPSTNADPTIQPGMRVRVDPQFRAFLLSQPNADDENIIGELEPGAEMLVQEGPVLRQGLTDTIVWWFVLTDAGDEGWVPANTSEVTVLQPLP